MARPRYREEKNILTLFTDAATSPQLGIAVGVYLCLDHEALMEFEGYSPQDVYAAIVKRVHYSEYTSKKSTWSEIRTVIDALRYVLEKKGPGHGVELYTDCQNVMDLLGVRKEKLEDNNFMTRTGKVLHHAETYKELYEISKLFTIHTVKIKGHAAKAQRVTLHQKIFTVIDKLSRKRLRASI